MSFRLLVSSRGSTRLVLTLALTVISVVVLWLYLDVTEIYDQLQKVSFGWCLLALALYATSLVARAFRLNQLLTSKIGFRFSLDVISKYSVINYFVPLKLGEVSMPVMLKRHGASTEESIWVWGLARMLDLLFVVCIGLYVFWADIVALYQYEYVMLVLFVLAACVYAGRRWLPEFQVLNNFYFYVKNFNNWAIFGVIANTVVSWFLVYCVYYVLLIALGQAVGFQVCIAALVLMAPITFLPVNSVAGVGGFQAAWVGAMLMDGWVFEEALNAAVLLHILISITVLLVGVAMLKNPLGLLRRGG